jgi:hypothetical protein
MDMVGVWRGRRSVSNGGITVPWLLLHFLLLLLLEMKKMIGVGGEGTYFESIQSLLRK